MKEAGVALASVDASRSTTGGGVGGAFQARPHRRCSQAVMVGVAWAFLTNTVLRNVDMMREILERPRPAGCTRPAGRARKAGVADAGGDVDGRGSGRSAAGASLARLNAVGGMEGLVAACLARLARRLVR